MSRHGRDEADASAGGILITAGVLGVTAILAGTFAAHGLEGLIEPHRLDVWEVGARYHAYHALAVVGCLGASAVHRKLIGAAVACFAGGTLVFAGSLYLLALTGIGWLGAITPIGGVLLVAGWALLTAAGWRALRRRLETPGA